MWSKKTYPITYAQKRIWYSDVLFPHSGISNIGMKAVFKRQINKDLLKKAIRMFVKSEEAMRVHFREQHGGEPFQYVAAYEPFDIPVIDHSHQKEEEIDTWLEQETKLSLRLYNNFLFAFKIIKANNNKTILYGKFHHIIIDGISSVILLNKIVNIYIHLLKKGEHIESLPTVPLGYLNMDREYEQSKRFIKDQKFWKDEFATIPEDLLEKTYHLYKTNTEAVRKMNKLPKALQDKMFQFCQNYHISIQTLFTSLLFIYMHRTTNNDDIVIGTNFSNRGPKEKDMLGMFVSTTPYRLRIDPNLNVLSFIQLVRKKQMRLLRHQKYPYNRLLMDIRKQHEEVRQLFTVGLEYQELPVHSFVDMAEDIFCGYEPNEFTIHVKKQLYPEQIYLNIDYRTALFSEDDINNLFQRLLVLLDDMITHPNKQLGKLEICTKREKEQVLFQFNHTSSYYSPKNILHVHFEQQVEKNPDQTAIVCKEQKLTYKELNERANRFARTLRQHGVQRDERVALIMDRSIEMVIGILAILKSGGAYVPIDPDYPEERIQYILKDSDVTLLVSNYRHVKKFKAITNVQSRWLDIENRQNYHPDSSNLTLINEPNDLAYIIYTSGTTGKPKGVMIEHRSIPNLILSFKEHLQMNQTDKIAQFASISFDVSVEEIWLAFFSGSTLYIIQTDVISDFIAFEQYVNKHQLTILQLPPAYMKHLHPNHLHSVRKVVVGGDVSTPDLVEKWKDVFIHVYGATEATVDSTVWEASRNEVLHSSVSVGRPIANTQIYILNEYKQPQPIGVPGEIYIGGAGLARGYLNDRALTENKFVANPFIPGGRMYRTGDLGRWSPNGQLEFLGRMDQQVKIRGYRIEIDEIEAVLSQHPAIDDVAVVNFENAKGEAYLCAYIVLHEQLHKQDIKEYLRGKLPNYMIPSFIIQIDTIPITINGKVNRNALPKPNEKAFSEIDYVAPHTKIERKLTDMWCDILQLDKIGVNHDFFELGGHSLHAIRLMAELRKMFEIEVPVRIIFEYRTIRELASYIEQLAPTVSHAIEPVPSKLFYPLASAQKGLYFLHRMKPSATHYNMPVGMIIEGPLHVTRLENAFKQLIKRHDALRTSFDFINEEPIQKIAQDVDFSLPYRTIEDELLTEAMVAFVQPFDLQVPPLLRAELIKLTEQRHALLLDMHHIISDGVSIDILFEELARLYNGEKLLPLRIQYKDYAVWQQEQMQSETMRKQEKYWLETFAEGVPTIELPTDYPRPADQSFRGDCFTFYINSEETNALKQLSMDVKATMYMTLLAIYNVLLYKYTNESDLIVGTPTIGRNTPEVDSIVGMFVNTLPIRNQMEGKDTFKQFLKKVKERVLQVFEHQDYPFDVLVEKLNVPRESNRHPLFNTLFGVQDFKDLSLLKMDGLTVHPYEWNHPVSKFDFTLLLQEKDGEIECLVEYSTSLFKRETMERLTKHFRNIIKQVITNQEKTLDEIDIVSDEEKIQILDEWNNTNGNYQNKPIHLLFEEQVQKTPNKVAVVLENEQLTYEELNKRANRIARVLRNQKNVKPDDCVALISERSLEMIVGILGVLKAGGAYVPIDPEYPIERIQYMLNDCQAKVILSQSTLVERLADKLTDVGSWLEIDRESLHHVSPANLSTVNKVNHLAYIIYTSGTTGRPKGTMIEHSGVVNMTNYFINSLEIEEKDRIGQFASISFDASVMEIWTALLTGITLVLIPKAVIADYVMFETYVTEQHISIMLLPPTYMKHLQPKKFKTLRKVIAAGSASSPHLVKEWSTLYLNGYGPTETTVIVTTWKDETKEQQLSSVPIGRPIINMNVYILNEHKQLQPIGIPGEIYISGVGLARGYLNLPKLTEEKFVPNPFVPGTKMYRTGDLGRWLPNGNIEYLGRIDHQVKVRGYRVELGEIEEILTQHQFIRDAVVVDHVDQQGDTYLCAYVVSKEQKQKLNMTEVKEYLTKKLPNYMLPSFYIQLEHIPLTTNDKVDRKALPKPTNALLENEYVAPETEVERQLINIWERILDIEHIGVSHSFFDVGGHSLHAIRLVIEIHQTLEVEVPVQIIFERPTIRELGKYIEELSQVTVSSIQPMCNKEPHYPVSSAQKRLYVLNQLDPESIHYNIPGGIIMEGSLNVSCLEKAFQQLIDRHEILRTSFEIVNNEPVQKVSAKKYFKLHCQKMNEEHLKEKMKDFIQPFDLQSAPLLRAELIEITEQKHILLLDIHHIISDGTSIDLLLKELIKLYNGEDLPELQIQYKDYAVWQKKQMKTEEMKKQEKYWLKTFANEISVLELPTDNPRPLVQDFSGDVFEFRIDARITKRLKKLVKDTGTTLYMTLLAAYNVLLYKYTNKTDIIVGSPIIGRSHPDVQQVLGMFVNTLALKNQPKGEKRFIQFLHEVKAQTLKAYDNQDYPFELLVEKLDLHRDLSRNPLFNTLFSVQDFGNVTHLNMDGLSVRPLQVEFPISKFDLTLMAMERDNEIVCTLEYSTALFKRETIKRLAEHFIEIVSEITMKTDKTIDEISMLSDNDKERLDMWNETDLDIPSKTIHTLFEEQTEKTPDHIAIVYKQDQLTYRELNEKANRLARTLRQRGVTSDECVALMMERSLDMVVGVLAILKAGGAYVPIDSDYPLERIQYMVENSRTKWILSQADVIRKVANKIKINDTVEWLDITEDIHFNQESSNLKHNSQPSQLAYVIYTSGTTGKPKGVMMEHRNLIHLFAFQSKQTDIPFHERVLQFTSIGFDVSFQEIFSTLLAGGQLHIVPQHAKQDVSQLFAMIQKQQISVAFFPVAFLKFLFSQKSHQLPKCIKHIITAGEQLIVSPSLRDYLQKNGVYLHNHYGPTETHVVTTNTLSPNGLIPEIPAIGKPIHNNKIYILNEKQNQQPIGIVGELYVAGKSVGRGYLNKPQLTAEKFIDSPFHADEKMYRTGDLARWLPNGKIEYVGRLDHQVKILGYRIELEEIESVLLQHPTIRDAAVVHSLNEQGDSYLCAYVTADEELDINEIRLYLRRKLPNYMIPPFIIQIKQIPLTSNGKVNKKKLAKWKVDHHPQDEYLAPTTKLEQQLVTIWEDILGIQGIGVTNNFFQSGGNSLNALALVSRIRDKLDIQLPLRFVFQKPTIAEMATYLHSSLQTIKTEPITRLNKVTNRNIFCFAPIIGYGTVFSELAAYIDSHTLYGIDFIEHEDRLEKYMELILRIQKKGPYIFMGYSAGATLAFELAKYMEQRGYVVSDIIMLDAQAQTKKWLETEQDIIDEAQYTVDFFTSQKVYKKYFDDVIKEELLKSVKSYLTYWNNCFNTGMVDATIHQLKAVKTAETENFTHWEGHTKNYCLYEGSGTHYEMLIEPYLQKNAELLNNIIANITRVKV